MSKKNIKTKKDKSVENVSLKKAIEQMRLIKSGKLKALSFDELWD